MQKPDNLLIPGKRKKFAKFWKIIDNLANNRILPVRKHWHQERWNVMEPVHKHWHQGRFKRKRGNAETFNLFNAFMVSKVFNELHCHYCPSLPVLSFCAFYILQCPSVHKAELWALRACWLKRSSILIMINVFSVLLFIYFAHQTKCKLFIHNKYSYNA